MDASLLALLGSLTVIVCALGFIVVLGGAILFVVVQGFSSTAQRLAYRPPVISDDYLASVALAPWTPAALADLACRWEGWWRGTTSPGRQDSYAQGVVKSLANPAGPGWVAFTLERSQFRQATVVVKTSDRRVKLTVGSTGALDANIRGEAEIDGQPHGTLAVTYPSVVYRPAQGGEARWVGEVRLNNERRAGGRLLARDVLYDLITFNHRPLAALTDTWIRYPHPQSTKPIPPAFRSVAEPLAPAEQDVLLVALALGLYYDNLRRRKKIIYDW